MTNSTPQYIGKIEVSSTLTEEAGGVTILQNAINSVVLIFLSQILINKRAQTILNPERTYTEKQENNAITILIQRIQEEAMEYLHTIVAPDVSPEKRELVLDDLCRMVQDRIPEIIEESSQKIEQFFENHIIEQTLTGTMSPPISFQMTERCNAQGVSFHSMSSNNY